MKVWVSLNAEMPVSSVVTFAIGFNIFQAKQIRLQFYCSWILHTHRFDLVFIWFQTRGERYVVIEIAWVQIWNKFRMRRLPFSVTTMKRKFSNQMPTNLFEIYKFQKFKMIWQVLRDNYINWICGKIPCLDHKYQLVELSHRQTHTHTAIEINPGNRIKCVLS